MKCIEMIRQLSSSSADSANASSEYFSRVSQNPIDVLEDLCLNYKSDDDDNNNKNSTSPQSNFAHNSPDVKRKKLNI
jgi:hypothetical protein